MDELIKRMEKEAAEKRNAIRIMAKRLASDMLHEVDTMDVHPDYIPNGIGIVQTSGPRLDILCAEYALMRWHLKELKKAAAE
jgi:hypothetical protein